MPEGTERHRRQHPVPADVGRAGSVPRGGRGAAARGVHGPPEKTEALVDGLAALGPAICKAVQPVPWSVANSMLHSIAPPDHRSYTKGAYLSELTDDVIDIVTRHAAAHLPSNGPVASTVQNLWSMGGAVTEDFDEDSAAFSREGANWFWETVTLWDTPDEDAGFHAWVDGVHAELKPHVRANCYVNLSTTTAPSGAEGCGGAPRGAPGWSGRRPTGTRTTCCGSTRTSSWQRPVDGSS